MIIIASNALQWSALTVALVLASGFGNAAVAGQIMPGDFQGNQVVTDFDDLGLPFENATPVVLDDNTYTTDDGTLRYFPTWGDAIGRSGDAVGSNTDLGYIDIVLGTAALRAGGYVGSLGLEWSVTATFFDESDTLLGTVMVSGAADTNQFAGWEADTGLIKRVRFTDTIENRRITILDDFTTEVSAIPEPSSLAMSVLGALTAGGCLGRKVLRRRRTA